MLIQEIKENYPLVYDRIIHYTNKDEGTVLETFGWISTAEGSAFWSAMNKRNITKAKELQPHLFEDIPIIGNIYVSGNYIHDIVSNKPYKHNNTAIRIKSKIFYNKDIVLSLSNKKPGRLANQEEIDWFNACVKAGKFVEKPTSKKKVEFKVGDYYKTMVDAPNGTELKQNEVGKITEITPKYICLCFPYHVNYMIKKSSLQNTKLYTKVNPDELVSEKTIDYKISKKCKDSFKSEWEHGDILKNYKDEIEKRNQDKITSSNHLTDIKYWKECALELRMKDEVKKMLTGDSLHETFMEPMIVKKYKNKKSKLLIK